jgi:hypothetical protein
MVFAYESRLLFDLKDLARTRRIPGRSNMNKAELISALRGGDPKKTKKKKTQKKGSRKNDACAQQGCSQNRDECDDNDRCTWKDKHTGLGKRCYKKVGVSTLRRQRKSDAK